MPDTDVNRVRVSPESDLAKAMKAARSGGRRVVIDTGEDEYAVSVEEARPPLRLSHRARASEDEKRALWAGYDPERARAALAKAAGSWSDIDTDELVDSIYRRREEGSRPPGRG